MISVLGTVQLGLLAFLAFGLLASAGCAALHPWVMRRATGSGAARSRFLLTWLATPSIAAGVLTAVCFSPSVLAALGMGHDHCTPHDDVHAHFCVVHLAATAGGVAGWTLVALAAGGVTLVFAQRIVACFTQTRLLRQVATTGTPVEDVVVVDSRWPLSLAIGVLRPTICLSSKLIETLPEGLLRAVVEHERAHVRRRDALRKLVARLLAVCHAPWTRRDLLADLSLACEQACDEEAGQRVGDRLEVAEAILTVERSFAALGQPPLGAVAFGGSNVRARVEALVDESRTSRADVVLALALLAFGVATFLAAEPIHHIAETLLGFVAR